VSTRFPRRAPLVECSPYGSTQLKANRAGTCPLSAAYSFLGRSRWSRPPRSQPLHPHADRVLCLPRNQQKAEHYCFFSAIIRLILKIIPCTWHCLYLMALRIQVWHFATTGPAWHLGTRRKSVVCAHSFQAAAPD